MIFGYKTLDSNLTSMKVPWSLGTTQCVAGSVYCLTNLWAIDALDPISKCPLNHQRLWEGITYIASEATVGSR